ncbi:MAG: hypothetical protein GXO77_14595 [Calditrichaeota bacterium]|nr:hypothetical protein [Calditrichota bacterium]
MRTQKLLQLILLSSFFLLLVNCSGTRYVSMTDPESQASVRINLKDGTHKEGIIVTGDSTTLVYVDASTHQRSSIKFDRIKSIQKISKYFDFEGNAIPISEIKQFKSPKNMLLYGSAGLLLGAAVGTGVGIGLYAADQPLLANISILAFGGLGAYYFGAKGMLEDYENAAFAARKARYEEYKSLRAEKRRIEELKKKKEELLKKLQEKKRKKGENTQDVR